MLTLSSSVHVMGFGRRRHCRQRHWHWGAESTEGPGDSVTPPAGAVLPGTWSTRTTPQAVRFPGPFDRCSRFRTPPPSPRGDSGGQAGRGRRAACRLGRGFVARWVACSGRKVRPPQAPRRPCRRQSSVSETAAAEAPGGMRGPRRRAVGPSAWAESDLPEGGPHHARAAWIYWPTGC
jgi:hypothetical protein